MGRTCRLTLVGICHRLLFRHPAAKYRLETGDRETQQRLQSVSTGMSSFATTRLKFSKRVMPTGRPTHLRLVQTIALEDKK